MIIYTCITNGYDEISDDNFYHPGIQYVCFYDGEIKKKGKWKFVKLESDIKCPVRRSYLPKHLPHHFLKAGEYTMWIDASYTITRHIVDYFKNVFSYRKELVLQQHPEKRTIIEEFAKLYYNGFSTYKECLDFSRNVASQGMRAADYNHSINCLVFRHLTPEVNAWSESWRKWYMRGVNRDQISSSLAEFETIKAERTPLLVDLNKTTRIKEYGESYKLNPRPTFSSTMQLVREMSKFYGVSPKVAFDRNKMLNDLELSRYKTPIAEEEEVNKKDLVVYTCITEGYDEINPDNYYDPDVRYVMFYTTDADGIIDTAENMRRSANSPWEWRRINLPMIDDPKRVASYVKINPHILFEHGTHAVWVDGCYKLTKEFIDFSLQCFPCTVLRHPLRWLFLDQALEGFMCAYYSADQFRDFVALLTKDRYSFSDFKGYCGTVVWRTVGSTDEFCNKWWWYYKHGVNRDVFSMDAALQLTLTDHKVIENRSDTGLQLGYGNKTGRLLTCTQHGNINQWKESQQFLEDLGVPIPLHTMRTNPVDHVVQMNINGVDNDLGKVNAMVFPFDMNDSVDKSDMVIYTCITNGYDQLPNENYYDPEVRYVIFHDGTCDIPDPWIGIDIREYCDIKCPRRLSFFPKANPHLFFEKGTHTVWIDGCYQHTEKFVENSTKSFPFTMLRHASKFSYYDEMLEGFLCAFFTMEDGLELTRKLKELNYNFRKYSSPLGTIVWRTINDEIIEFNKLWYEYSLIGCNRDQISYDAALQLTGIKPQILEDRNASGVPLGFYGKIGRKGMHPQHGSKDQWKLKTEFLKKMQEITGLSYKIYTNYMEHSFYMSVYNIEHNMIQ